ncbi:MAG: type II secretion system major pseudopilin GspG [Planctomycetota bacterium]|nr:type II secretion system major pseudopilin GspG [Planctomycetota bacterium]
MKNNRRSRRNFRRGFTLLEVMLVLIILVVIAGFSIRNFTGVLDQANKRAATAQLAQLSSAVKQYQLMMQQLPASLDSLMTQPADLANPGDWTKLLDKLPSDPWNRPYEYKLNGSTFELRSLGADGQSGTSDDIVSS